MTNCVLVGFDRGGWSPALFKHMDENGFNVLTWRKGTTSDIDESKFAEVSHTDEHGERHYADIGIMPST